MLVHQRVYSCHSIRYEISRGPAAASARSVCQWDLGSGELLGSFEGHDDEINAIYATKKRILTGAQDGTAKEWCLEPGRMFDGFWMNLRCFVSSTMVILCYIIMN